MEYYNWVREVLTHPPSTNPPRVFVVYGWRQIGFDEFGQRIRRQHVSQHGTRHSNALDDRCERFS